MSMAIDVDGRPDMDLETCKALAEPVRWRVVELLAGEELCVCHLTEELGLPQPLVSHHLRVLREAGLVTAERWRYWTYYRLDADRLARVAARLASAAKNASTSGATRRPCC